MVELYTFLSFFRVSLCARRAEIKSRVANNSYFTKLFPADSFSSLNIVGQKMNFSRSLHFYIHYFYSLFYCILIFILLLRITLPIYLLPKEILL